VSRGAIIGAIVTIRAKTSAPHIQRMGHLLVFFILSLIGKSSLSVFSYHEASSDYTINSVPEIASICGASATVEATLQPLLKPTGESTLYDVLTSWTKKSLLMRIWRMKSLAFLGMIRCPCSVGMSKRRGSCASLNL
jgi:hypothetical protein